MGVPARAYLSIGEVLSKLRNEFPDVTISKIRFLETEGLLDPARTPSGYRKFTSSDLERLRYVLSAQRDQYLPLRVIKENLDALDRGLTPAVNGAKASTPRVASVNGELTNLVPDKNLKLNRSELLEAASITEKHLSELESYGLITIKGRYYDGDALAIARVVSELSAFGIESRHLRSYKTAADREVSLISQVVAPILKQRGSEASARAAEVERELATLSIKLHAALVSSSLSSSR
jgi:DNA-binding transcriptional MerR regulator